jgi:hypothetical protein
MSEPLRLSQAECNTDAWRRLKALYEERRDRLTAKALNLGTDEAERRDLLVRIDEIHRFLALGQPVPEKPSARWSAD